MASIKTNNGVESLSDFQFQLRKPREASVICRCCRMMIADCFQRAGDVIALVEQNGQEGSISFLDLSESMRLPPILRLNKELLINGF